MSAIHPTAIIHPNAQVADDVEIGPYCVVGEDVVIESGNVLESHVVIDKNTHLGMGNHIHNGAILGTPAQDRKYKDEGTFLRIGHSNLIREYVTIHRANEVGEETRVGDRNFLMAYTHIGHNCLIGSDIVMANSVAVAGHCIIEDGVNIGGITGVHQFTRIGKFAMVGGLSRVVRDIPPFMLAEGSPCKVLGINVVGLRRAGFPPETRTAIQTACRLIYYSGLNLSHAIEQVKTETLNIPEIDYLIEFMEAARQGRNGRQLDRPSRK
jgi:UDP-N-acetylglucosamine acyltransferase